MNRPHRSDENEVIGDGESFLFHSGPSPKKQRLTNGATSRNTHEIYDDIQTQKKSLPIFPSRYRLIKEVNRFNSVIIIGETGSGKTTQIPQFLYGAGVHRLSTIAVTQPRRIAAITIATRVATEMRVKLGEIVGYSVRFENVTSPDTKIKYLTDGMLLRESITDPLLKKYSVIILDEAHERTINTDILFGVVKIAQKERRIRMSHPLKIIVMSATMDVDHFSSFFNNAPVLYIEGRQYPVQIMYTKEPQEDYLFAALITIFQIHQSTPAQHDILMFLTGQEEIESAAKSIREISKSLSSDCPSLKVCTLYASLPSFQQLAVFQPTPKGCRKVILATNIAETSVTIHGIKYVIDTGMVKARTYNPGSGLDLLKVQKISKAQAWQRTGRAGRESRGTCYRIYTEEEFESLTPFTIPEIQRCNLANVMLQLLAIGINDVISFDFMDKPSTEAIISAFDQLNLLSAVEKQDKIQCLNEIVQSALDIKNGLAGIDKESISKSCVELTQLGKQMALFPLEPRFSKIILVAKEMGCTEEILSIIATLSVESVLFTQHSKREQANAARQKFESSEGDHIMLLNIYKAFQSVRGNKQWCQENFLHHRNLKMACEVRKQLVELCQQVDIPLRSCGHDTTIVRKCLANGMFMTAAELQKEGNYITLDAHQEVSIHPSSNLFMCKPSYVIYTELVQTSKCYIKNLSIVDPDWLHEAAPMYFKKISAST